MEVRPLTEISEADYRRIVTGYRSDEVFEATVDGGEAEFAFRFQLKPLAMPFQKVWPFAPGQFGWYRSLLALGLSFGAWEGGALMGLVISGTTEWSRIVNVWELHVAEDHRGRGAGRALLAAVEDAASRKGSGLFPARRKTLTCRR